MEADDDDEDVVDDVADNDVADDSIVVEEEVEDSFRKKANTLVVAPLFMGVKGASRDRENSLATSVSIDFSPPSIRFLLLQWYLFEKLV